METDPGFGARLAETRQLAGLSVTQLAKRAGLRRESLSRIECGMRGTTRAKQVQLYELLNQDVKKLSMLWFLTGAGAWDDPTVEQPVERREFVGLLARGLVVPSTIGPMLDLERLAAPTLDEITLDALEELTAQFARTRPMIPPASWIAMVGPHLDDLQSRIRAGGAKGPFGPRLLSLTAGTAFLYAYTSLNMGDRGQAGTWIAEGIRLARAAGDNDILALLLMLKADRLSAVPTGGLEGFPELARNCLTEAITLLSPSTPAAIRMSVLLRMAEEHAYAVDHGQALRHLVLGHEASLATENFPHPLRPGMVAGETKWFDCFRASCFQLLDRPQETMEMLVPILEWARPSHQPLVMTDLAAAYARAGELHEACEMLRAAAERVAKYGFTGAGRRIMGVRRRLLAGRDTEPDVRELDNYLALNL